MLEKTIQQQIESSHSCMVAYGFHREEQHIKIPHSGQLTESESMRAGIRQMKAAELPIRQQMTIKNRVSTK